MVELLKEILRELFRAAWPYFLGFVIILILIVLYQAVGYIEERIEKREMKQNRVLTEEDFINDRGITGEEFLKNREMTPVEKKMKKYAGLILTEVRHGISSSITEELYGTGIRRYNDIIYTYTFEHNRAESISFDNLLETVNVNYKFTDIRTMELIASRVKELGWLSW